MFMSKAMRDELIVLLGEGTFHQIRGRIATSGRIWTRCTTSTHSVDWALANRHRRVM